MTEILESTAWRKTWKEWGREMEVKPMLSYRKSLIQTNGPDCARLRWRGNRRMMIELTGSMAAFQTIDGGQRRTSVQRMWTCEVKVVER